MAMRWRFLAILSLLLPYVLVFGQSIGELLKSLPVPPTIDAKAIPSDFHAFQIRTSGSSADSAMESLMSIGMAFGGGNAEQSKEYEMYSISKASWTNGQMIKTETGEFLVTYVLDYQLPHQAPESAGHAADVGSTLRLALVRKDSIIEISPRPDLTPERMSNLFGSQAQGQRSSEESQTQAMSNFKQLSLGMLMYTTDSDDVMPYAQDTKSAFAVTQPYLKNSTLFKSLNPNGGRILMNMAVAGVPVTSVERPADTIMYYDERPWPDATRMAAFMDGHVKTIDGAQWREAEKSLHLKIKRTAKPLPPNYWQKIAPSIDFGGG